MKCPEILIFQVLATDLSAEYRVDEISIFGTCFIFFMFIAVCKKCCLEPNIVEEYQNF